MNAAAGSASDAASADLANPAAPGALALALFAVDPAGLGGVCLRSSAGPARDAWLAQLTDLLPAGTPLRRVPVHTDDDRLLGGLDLGATLQAGKPVAQRGLLAQADGGVLVVAMAERMATATAARIAAVMDTHQLTSERHGTSTRSAARFGVVALDEGISDDEAVPERLRERLGLWLTLDPRPAAQADSAAWFTREDIAAARAALAQVHMPDGVLQGLCAASLALGVASVRGALLACAAARAAAALDARDTVSADDASLAASLVLAPRATQLPVHEAADGDDAPSHETQEAPEPPEPQDPQESQDQQDPQDQHTPPPDARPPADLPDAQAAQDDAPAAVPDGAIDDLVLQAALSAIPPGLLALLSLGAAKPQRGATAGRVGATQASRTRGRPLAARRGAPQGGARLSLIDTLRAAAPWQALRRREALAAGQGADAAARVQVRRDDFHVRRFQQRSQSTTVFVVDASGSSALNRLAEAKGAVELLLADCYVRRDSVALIAFRGAAAELLLPPTRSLVRAKRSLSGLPGGGGTPLAAGLDAAAALADAVRRRGAQPVLVLLTDGRANIARNGKPGRPLATEDALAAARQLQLQGIASLLLDTSPQPQDAARALAAAMGARYLPLPHANAAMLSQAVRAVGAIRTT